MAEIATIVRAPEGRANAVAHGGGALPAAEPPQATARAATNKIVPTNRAQMAGGAGPGNQIPPGVAQGEKPRSALEEELNRRPQQDPPDAGFPVYDKGVVVCGTDETTGKLVTVSLPETARGLERQIRSLRPGVDPKDVKLTQAEIEAVLRTPEMIKFGRCVEMASELPPEKVREIQDRYLKERKK